MGAHEEKMAMVRQVKSSTENIVMRFSGQLNNARTRAQMSDVLFRELCGKVSVSLIDAFSVEVTPRAAVINVYAGKNVIPSEVMLSGLLRNDPGDNHPLAQHEVACDKPAPHNQINVDKVTQIVQANAPKVVTSPSVENDADWIKAYDRAMKYVGK